MRGAMAELWKRSVVRALVAEVGCGLLETSRRRGWGREERRTLEGPASRTDSHGWTFGSRSLGGLVALTEACPAAPAPASAPAPAVAGKASQRGARPGQARGPGLDNLDGGIALRKVLSLQLHSPGQSVVSSTSTSVDAQDPVNVDWQGCSQSVAEHCITKQHPGLHKHTLGRASSALIKHKTPGNGSTQPQVRAYAG